MAQKIYVGNLNYSTTEDILSSSFSQFGEVTSVSVIKDRFTDQSKGFAFVEMADNDAADAAIAKLNGQQIDGRQVRVSIAEDRPRPARPPRSGGFGGGGGGRRDGGYR
ncbi:MAG: RNA-binding protein [Spirochaetaceae bacterium]|jgi:RNA recognition motif-containing protein|nr:RNA-binding protein [Spirochaetaceae bacterium]